MSDPKLFETDGPTENVEVDNPEDVYTKMMRTEGMEMGFEVTREDPDPQKTFSQSALDTVNANMGLWVGTRIMRHYKEKGRGPKKLQVHLIVSLDGEVPPLMSTTPFIKFPDGHHRTMKKKK